MAASNRYAVMEKYWTITPPGWKKAIRIHQLGEDYTREGIERRIYDNDPSVRTERIRQSYRIPNQYNLRRRIDRIMGRSGLERLYLRYCYELGSLPEYRQNPTKLHIVLKEDLLKCDQYSEQAKLLSKYHVSTDEDLSLLMERIEQRLADEAAERAALKNKTRRVLPLQERSGHVRENLSIVDADRKREKER